MSGAMQAGILTKSRELAPLEYRLGTSPSRVVSCRPWANISTRAHLRCFPTVDITAMEKNRFCDINPHRRRLFMVVSALV